MDIDEVIAAINKVIAETESRIENLEMGYLRGFYHGKLAGLETARTFIEGARQKEAGDGE